MTQEERHQKISEGVAQIGRLIGTCAKHEMDIHDIMIMMQTSTSLVCEMNDVPIDEYMKFLYVLHKRRLDPTYDGSDENSVNAELCTIFAFRLDS